MLSHLRLKLTLLYMATAAALALLVSGSAYSLLYYYFQSTTDDALRYKMSEMFLSLDLPLPLELSQARQGWLAQRNNTPMLYTEKNEEEKRSGSPIEIELSDIFVFPLDRSGQLLFNPNPFDPPMAPDVQAAAAALQNGSDLRLINLSDGTPVRLLTYPLSQSTVVEVMQLGRPISSQMNVLNQLLGGLMLLAAISVAGLGAGSWWLAGKTLGPAQRAWELQQTFVANASHELRTPLTLIRASTEMVRRHTPPDSSQVQLLDDVIDESDHMTRLVEDLLLLSRLDAKKLVLDRQNVDLVELSCDLQRQFVSLCLAQAVQLEVKVPALKVIGDPTRLRQVLLILLDNALRHTPAGGTVTMDAGLHKHGVKVRVTDTGRGIPPEHLPHIFERFYQAHSTSRGAGLGLSIAKSLTEAMGGQIGIASEANRGTEVWLLLPSQRKSR